MISSRQRLLWAGLLAGATFAASAQTPVPPAAEAQPGAQQKQQQSSARAEHRRDPAQRWERMREHRAQRLAALKQKLQLTPAQEGAWQSFSTASQPPAQAPQRVDRAEFAKLTTPQRLDRMQARQAQRAERLAARAAATRGFYAALTSEQQKVFDTESLHFGPHGDHGHHRHHRHATTGTGAAAPAV